MNIKYARILNTYCPTGDAVNPVCGRLPSTWKGRTWCALSSPDGQSPLSAPQRRTRSGVFRRWTVPPGPAAGGTPPAAPAGHGACASGHPPQDTSPAPHTPTPRPVLPSAASSGCGRVSGSGAWGSARGQERRGTTPEGAPLGALSLSQRWIREISSYGSTKPLRIKLRTSPGILSWAFYHRGYSLGLNHQYLSLVFCFLF